MAEEEKSGRFAKFFEEMVINNKVNFKHGTDLFAEIGEDFKQHVNPIADYEKINRGLFVGGVGSGLKNLVSFSLIGVVGNAPKLAGAVVDYAGNGLGMLAGGTIKAGAMGLHMLGDRMDDAASYFQRVGHDPETNILVRGAARIAAALPKAVGGPSHIAAAGLSKASDAIQSGVSTAVNVINVPISLVADATNFAAKLIYPSTILKEEAKVHSSTDNSLQNMGDSFTKTVSSTIEILSETTKEAGTQLVDSANKTDIPGLSTVLRFAGRFTQSVGLSIEGLAHGHPIDGLQAAAENLEKSAEEAIKSFGSRARTVQELEEKHKVEPAIFKDIQEKRKPVIEGAIGQDISKMSSKQKQLEVPQRRTGDQSEEQKSTQPPSWKKIGFSAIGAVVGIATAAALIASGPIGMLAFAAFSAYGAKKIYDDVRGDYGDGPKRSMLVALGAATVGALTGAACGYGMARATYSAGQAISGTVFTPNRLHERTQDVGAALSNTAGDSLDKPINFAQTSLIPEIKTEQEVKPKVVSSASKIRGSVSQSGKTIVAGRASSPPSTPRGKSSSKGSEFTISDWLD